jgi:hypothetical protein
VREKVRSFLQGLKEKAKSTVDAVRGFIAEKAGVVAQGVQTAVAAGVGVALSVGSAHAAFDMSAVTVDTSVIFTAIGVIITAMAGIWGISQVIGFFRAKH